jgi:SHS2 domain-containing protein
VGGFEILEHTADVGIRARGPTLEACFEQATWGLADIAGIARPGPGEPVEIELAAGDVEALLVDWLSEALYLHEVRDAVIAAVCVDEVTSESARGRLSLVPRADVPTEGTQVKAITYHKLSVRPTNDGFVADVYVDV